MITLTLLAPRDPSGRGDDKRWLLIVGSTFGHRRHVLHDAHDQKSAMAIADRILGYTPNWHRVVVVKGWPQAWSAVEERPRKKGKK